MLGTDFPYRNFYPTKAKIIQVDQRPEALGRRAPLELGLIGDVTETIRGVLPRSSERPIGDFSKPLAKTTRVLERGLTISPRPTAKSSTRNI